MVRHFGHILSADTRCVNARAFMHDVRMFRQHKNFCYFIVTHVSLDSLILLFESATELIFIIYMQKGLSLADLCLFTGSFNVKLTNIFKVK